VRCDSGRDRRPGDRLVNWDREARNVRMSRAVSRSSRFFPSAGTMCSRTNISYVR
jgi:hypothetical protein